MITFRWFKDKFPSLREAILNFSENRFDFDVFGLKLNISF